MVSLETVVPMAPLEETDHGAVPAGTGFLENETALGHGAGVEQETSDPSEAYARFTDDKPIPCPREFPGG